MFHKFHFVYANSASINLQKMRQTLSRSQQNRTPEKPKDGWSMVAVRGLISVSLLWSWQPHGKLILTRTMLTD